ncbi:homoserine kinase [Acuticoccus sp. MNP-M23]|uniref:homoserine kinase n=1 Tax=Acuticoccus sp. MNP-M23 TaxID=3072793 RepID=UPI0028158E5C|nr:homoserine kinase [Acuticoccus sp. MNP-M23]WMS42972.1 homoserine kinase [Acuticoccus sp. MNP-M23]
MAVYTHVDDEALAAFLTLYDVGDMLSVKGIAEGVENTNYLLRTEQGTFILTLYEQRVDRDELPFFLHLMEHAADKGLAVPRPVHRRDGGVISQLCGRAAAMITFLDGVAARRPGPLQCAELGRGLAAFHAATADFGMTRRNGLGMAAWAPLFAQSRETADTVLPGLTAMVSDELECLAAAWPTTLPTGIIHADLFPDNVFFVQKKLSGLIDFYFACNDILAYDLAICLNAWCFEEDGSFNVTKSQAMTSAYAAVRPLSDAEVEAMPILARGAALRFLLTRLHDWLRVPEGALVTPKDPVDYVNRLRFHRQVTRASEYGISL